jgi:dipeptidyl aminopeptidase/acylaminoacyl peptidase
MEFERSFYSKGIPLSSTITVPDEKDILGKKYPTVILLHGHSRYRNDGLNRLAKVLGDNGFASIRFDFRGCGEKAVNRYHLYCDSEMPEDVISALSFAESLPFVDDGRLGLAGISLGALMTVCVCGMGESRVKSAVAMSGAADMMQLTKSKFSKSEWESLLEKIKEDRKIAAATGVSQMVNRLEMINSTQKEKEFGIIESLLDPGQNEYITLDSFTSAMRVKPISVCGNIDCPIFFMHGEVDEIIPPENSKMLYEKVKRSDKKIKIYEGVDHNIPICKKRETVFRDIVEWFQETL